MGQPVKISDGLVLDARQFAQFSERSIAGQIEFWAQLGRAIEPILAGDRVHALRQAGAVLRLSQAVASVDTPSGRDRVADYLQRGPFPHFQALAGSNGLLIRIEEDGTRTTGRFVGRVFQPAP